MIDPEGFRENVGIILLNRDGRLFWARRIRQNAWQFPQGGLQEAETPEQALFRELKEEIGLSVEDVEVLGCTTGWLRYRLPKRYIRTHCQPLCIGQKQKWFMLGLVGPYSHIRLDQGTHPEFDRWRWVNYWHPLREVVSFKRNVYRKALQELEHLVQSFRKN
ncbi:MAG: RNA pyrophosphohydrolase [Gammaproteobacteria bacterium]